MSDNSLIRVDKIKIGEKFLYQGKTYTRGTYRGRAVINDYGKPSITGVRGTDVAHIEKHVKVNTVTRVFMSFDNTLYCIPALNRKGESAGFSCLGIDVAFNRAARYREWLRVAGIDFPPAKESNKGKLAGYEEYRAMVDRIHAWVDAVPGRRCDADLSPQLNGLEGRRVEVVTTYGETRRFQVGKSTGWLPCHLEIANKASSGGIPAEPEYKSVRVVD